MKQRTVVQLALAGILAIGIGSAQNTVTLPDESESTTMTANVSEQANVTVPGSATFNVTDISSSTVAGAVSVTIDNVVLASATKQLKVSLQADAASFTPPIALATTWVAGDVSWGAGSWTSATGASGTLSSSEFTEVATCAADTAGCSTTGLTFTLAPNTSVKRSGNHTLVVGWKFESIGA